MLSATIAALEADLKWTFLAEYESCRRISYRAVGGGLIQGDRASEIDIVSPDMQGTAEMMTCPKCSGKGSTGDKTCDRCLGRGKIRNRS
jgi:RecJ-like exonuclease